MMLASHLFCSGATVQWHDRQVHQDGRQGGVCVMCDVQLCTCLSLSTAHDQDQHLAACDGMMDASD